MDKENSILPVFKLAMEEVRTADLKESAGRFALEYDEGIHLNFLVRSYVVTNQGVFKESKLGVKKDDVLVSGGVSFIFEPLKHILVKLVFYPADDEFSAGGSILLDASATDFLGFETLAFLLTILSRKLTERDFCKFISRHYLYGNFWN